MNTYAIVKYSLYDEKNIEKQISSFKNYKNTKDVGKISIIKYEQKTKNSKAEILHITKDIEPHSTLIIHNLSSLGRYTDMIYDTILALLEKNITIVSIYDKYQLSRNDKFSKFILKIGRQIIDMEKELSSHRTKEALYYKKLSGVVLGKPVGTIQKSKFDKDINNIKNYLRAGNSIRHISKLLGYNNHIGLNNYIKKRNIRKNL